MNDSIFSITAKKIISQYAYSEEATFAIYVSSLLDNVNMMSKLEEIGYDLDKIKEHKVKKCSKIYQEIDLTKYRDDYLRYKRKKTSLFYKNTEEILDEISYHFQSMNYNVELCTMIDCLFLRQHPDNLKIDELSFKYIFNDIDTSIKIIQSKIKEIKSYYYNLKPSYFIEDETCIELLELANIKTFKDLSETDPRTIYYIFVRNIEKLDYLILLLSTAPKQNYLNLVDEIENEFIKKDKIYDVIIKRNGFYSTPKTLEEIGDEYGVTRERIRQIQEKGDNIILKKSKEINLFIRYIFNSISNNKKFFKRYDLEEKYGNKVSNFTKVFANVIEEDYCYSKKYDIFFLRGTLEDIIDEELNDMPISFTQEEYNNLDDFYKRIVDNNYSLRKNNLLVKVGSNITDIYTIIVDNLFPDGIICNDENVELINRELVNVYELEPITPHSLSANLARLNYCFIERGKMINRKYAASLDRELLDKILRYIASFESVVYYTSIYEVFREELNDIGVNNRYYLKGVLDCHLPEEYTTKRDYISVGETFISSSEAIINEMYKIKGIISIDDLKRKFPGVKDYVFLTTLSSVDEIVWYSYGKKFITLSNIELSQKFKETVKSEIEFLYKNLNSEVITSYKLYSRMKIMHKQLMQEHKFIDNQFFFFSIIKLILDNQYYFRRPYISKSKDCLSNEVIIDNFVNNQIFFTPKIINNFVEKMNMRGIYSYLEYMINKSEDFVQINIDTCIKKENLFIDDKILNSIKYELDFYINSFGELNLTNISIFSYLPKLKYAWNKYLLVGIIRTYLSNEYEIEYTDTMYNNTEFIIRRSK